MLTTSDIKKLLEIFATKEDLKNLVTKIEFQDSFNKIMTKLDAVFKEVKDMRVEQTAHLALHERIDREISEIKNQLPNIKSPQ